MISRNRNNHVPEPIPEGWVPETKRNNQAWEPANDLLWLLTRDEFFELPVGTVVTSIMGRTYRAGIDPVSLHVQNGWLSYGILESQITKFLHSGVVKA